MPGTLAAMDHEEAHRLLGLYVGATPEHIHSKFESMSAEVRAQLEAETDAGKRAALQSQLESLAQAREAALNEEAATDTQPSMINPATRVIEPPQAPAPAPAGSRGKYVVLFMAVTMVLIASTSLLGIWYFDSRHEAQDARLEREETVATRDAWRQYLAARNLKQTPDGQRAEDVLKLGDESRDSGDAEQAIKDYRTAQDLFKAALEAENDKLGEHWNTDVLKFWRDRLKGRYPFDPAADSEASLKDVAKLFHPKRGALWKVADGYQALRGVSVDDRQYATTPKNYQRIVAQGEKIRNALFGEGPGVDVRFAYRLVGEKTFVVVTLETGGASATNHDKNFVAAHWTPDSAGAHLYAKKLGDRTTKQTGEDLRASSWGMLVVLNHGAYKGEKDGVYSWHFELLPDDRHSRFRKKLEGDIEVQLTHEPNPFDPGLYSEFKPD
jgi:hypothetical protein